MQSPHQQRQPQQPVSEDDNEPGPSSRQPRRGTRACDRCRKIKSKCESIEDSDRCRNCVAAGTPCTFQGPSFKRGPPKGYIHAIEQRWHQVECILATVMALPRTQELVADIRQDPFARDILDRVSSGPYGSVGRAQRGPSPGQDGFYNTIMAQSMQAPSALDDRRSKRQSRMSRELVSNQDTSKSALPTAEWQEHLYKRLSGTVASAASGFTSPATRYSPSSSDQARFPSWSSSEATSPVALATSAPGQSGEPSRRRQRMDPSLFPGTVRSNHSRTQYSHDPAESHDEEEYDEAVDAFGHLSVDQNQEVRYHGRSAGLHLLAKSDRTDDSQQKENGIWKFNLPHLDADCGCLSFDTVNERIELPDVQTQDNLITLYFTYVHHFFPVIHKPTFLTAYYERNPTGHRSAEHERVPGQREPMQTVTKLLLLAMFAFAARYLPDANSQAAAESVQERLPPGQQYAFDARRLLNTIYEDSRPSICQALLLLGLREFGLGAMAQGWMYTGMGCRMAIDLGMNRDAERWKDVSGKELFTPIEKQIRKQIWWSCCIADKLSAVWLGRPVMYRKGDFSTPEPDLDVNEDQELWRPYPRDILGPNFTPMPAHVMSCFREQCKLSFLICDIMNRLYPVKWIEDISRRAVLEDLDGKLQQWLVNLPDALQYHESSQRQPAPPPHVIVLHIEYHSAILLLHRAFLPNWSEGNQRLPTENDADLSHAKCLNICSTAASRVSSLISVYDSIFGLKRAPPLMNIFLQSAGIMHVVTLTRRPRDTLATIGLIQCIKATEIMQDVWPGTILIRSLLKGAKVQMDELAVLSQTASERPKRGVDEALGEDRNSDLLQQHLYGLPPISSTPGSTPSSSGLQSQSPYIISEFSSPTSNLTPSLSYVPGYEWWPQLVGPGTGPGQGYAQDPFGYHQASTTSSVGGPQLVPPQGLFTFDQSQLTSDFMQGVQGVQSGAPGPAHASPNIPGSARAGPGPSTTQQQQHRARTHQTQHPPHSGSHGMPGSQQYNYPRR